ncbi:MAG: hypothetical protein J5497_02400 [Selenomonadaceae bacterium]|nr:hypothetical protein [Selenomonadaceae bacterium]
MKKLWDKFGDCKTLAVVFTAFATGYSIISTPDFFQFLSNYLAGVATVFAVELVFADL